MAIAYNTSIVRNGLVMYFDAANPKSYPGSGATWFDLSSLRNNGTLINGTLFNTDTKGINFDGGDEDFRITPNAALATILGSSNLTIETFVKSTNVVYPRSRHPFFINDIATSSSNKGWSVGHNASSTSIEVRASDGVSLAVGTISHTVQESTTYHRIFTIDRSSGLLTKYYVNGNYIGQFNAPSITGTIFSNQIIKFGDVWGWRYIGDLYIIKIYSRLLSESEIQANFQSLRGRYDI
jgi:hypothetical protein